ncbi:MAG: glycosyltransferase family 2 protein, partial [Actinomycetota bacterium]|nr:glycosyltransferase family 2 protein [Actinomycetota bacterium]
MFGGKRVGVVVPCYNEERLIGTVIRTMPEYVDRIIVVDDMSSDGTVGSAEALIEEMPGRLRVIRHQENGGVGKAITTGYRVAVEEKIDVTVVMAGDAQMDPEDLPALLEPVTSGACDYSKGNRLFTGDAWKIIPRHRYLGNAALSLMTKIASGYWHVADSQTGYTAVSLAALETIELDNLYPRYGFPNDMLVHLNIYGFRVRDVPIRPVYGVGERSDIQLWKVVPTLSWLLFKRFWYRMFQKYVIRDTHPLVLFY